MTQRQISDESLAARLLTGAWVEIEDPVSGSLKVAIDDLLAGVLPDTTRQVVDASDTMEVEATTLAARATLRPDDANYDGWQVGRYAWAGSNFAYQAGTTAVTDFVLNVFSWTNKPGIVVLKKVNACLASGALGGTSPVRAGLCNMKLWRLYGLDNVQSSVAGDADAGVASNMAFPASPLGATGSASYGMGTPATLHAKAPGAVGASGMIEAQSPGQARFEAGLLLDPTTAGGRRGFLDANPLCVLESAAPNSSGVTIFNNAPLYDWRTAEQPLILVPGTGFQVTVSWPAVTGTVPTMTMMPFCNFQWDEWTLARPGGGL